MLAADRYRFSGYNLPTVKLDDGFEYYVVGVHPYFKNQPMVFQEPAFSIGLDTAGGNVAPLFSPNAPVNKAKKVLKTPPPILPI